MMFLPFPFPLFAAGGAPRKDDGFELACAAAFLIGLVVVVCVTVYALISGVCVGPRGKCEQWIDVVLTAELTAVAYLVLVVLSCATFFAVRKVARAIRGASESQ